VRRSTLVHVSSLHVDPDHRVPNLPALHLFADVVLDAVNLVRGLRKGTDTLPTRPCDVAAARAWIQDGNVGVLSFNEACGWLGWDADHMRRAILRPLCAASSRSRRDSRPKVLTLGARASRLRLSDGKQTLALSSEDPKRPSDDNRRHDSERYLRIVPSFGCDLGETGAIDRT